jgi:hypothetical protein
MQVLTSPLTVGSSGAPRTCCYNLQPLPLPPVNDPETKFALGVEQFRAPELLRDTLPRLIAQVKHDFKASQGQSQ